MGLALFRIKIVNYTETGMDKQPPRNALLTIAGDHSSALLPPVRRQIRKPMFYEACSATEDNLRRKRTAAAAKKTIKRDGKAVALERANAKIFQDLRQNPKMKKHQTMRRSQDA